MVVTDTISDMLTTIRNGLLLSKEFVKTPSSKIKLNLLKILQEEGFIKSFKENEIKKGIKEIKIDLSYTNGKPAIKIISRISKPGRRVYSKLKDLPSYFKGYGVTIVTTSKGIMTDKKARLENLSGEILCQVF
ncbi:MAG: 30S ribosomal protein S8 [Alphaproteobacteria bacterium MarineAlpha6_Bin6]|nr:30S ribosomal protein S8 [Pelagibacteraceae bacterium]PPR31718.1 MAG: 30S ribosomal protein S8 [Alphaproteobacteria bacterium MarineAlpha6_Bin6]PPR32677.1 MAG: 30S ribosomal protein S8 [Alphaproteobacteria bacterium MarineAlpha6_Bin5]|tara:strand:+ start:177 stop:575 length:399 start_codon:yes stop_codon:yes gene_type:complete